MTTYEIIRFEAKETEVFFQIKLNDAELGIFNFAKWLTPDQVARYNDDKDTKDAILTSYIQEALQWKTEQNNAPEEED